MSSTTKTTFAEVPKGNQLMLSDISFSFHVADRHSENPGELRCSVHVPGNKPYAVVVDQELNLTPGELIRMLASEALKNGKPDRPVANATPSEEEDDD